MGRHSWGQCGVNTPACGAEFLSFTSETFVFRRGLPVDALWQHVMVERHVQALSVIMHAILEETTVAGTEQLNFVLLMAPWAKHRRPGTTGYSPKALIYWLDERVVANGLGHVLEQPNDTAITRHVPAHTITIQYRKMAMRPVSALKHTERWQAAIRYPSRPADTTICSGHNKTRTNDTPCNSQQRNRIRSRHQRNQIPKNTESPTSTISAATDNAYDVRTQPCPAPHTQPLQPRNNHDGNTVRGAQTADTAQTTHITCTQQTRPSNETHRCQHQPGATSSAAKAPTARSTKTSVNTKAVTAPTATYPTPSNAHHVSGCSYRFRRDSHNRLNI